MSKIAAFIYKLLGWKTVGSIPPELKKYVILAAPHTSNWDFLYGRLYFYIFKIPVKFFIKKEWFFFPMGFLFDLMGGVPVDRSKNTNLTDEIAKSFEQNDKMAMMVTPEGTRSYSPDWKKGFYFIAQKANVPIILGFLDYPNKEAGFGPVFYPTGDIDKDIEEIKSFYRTKKGRFPEKGVL
ncbi:glycerol acyltransferase [Vicingus serpentipes]|uniref:Glycerol acyltransferase n=1 Tax=Vicingus serpentipes TaxID=1926625 RepID=A0A5C6S0Q4_9FLAO|nr:lysophospholipid acyltransferase family protein [Vicingus serpentipes]TXB67182.1 glycerol acyltransferase [Vicingus serpentipes]